MHSHDEVDAETAVGEDEVVGGAGLSHQGDILPELGIGAVGGAEVRVQEEPLEGYRVGADQEPDDVLEIDLFFDCVRAIRVATL